MVMQSVQPDGSTIVDPDWSSQKTSFSQSPAPDEFPVPAGSPSVGQIPQVTTASPLALGWSSIPAGGSVNAVAAGDASVAVGGTTSNPTVETGTLDQIAALHPPVAPVGFNGQKATGLANGSSAQDAAAFGQLPTLGSLGAAPSANPTFTGTVTVPAPTSASAAVTKAYADAIAQGLSIKLSVQEATAAALPANTYANGASGVGATLTAAANAALVVDGITAALNDRVLVQDEVTASHDGIYTVTATGSGGAPYVLTRAADMNTAAQVPGAFCFTEQGTANAGAGFAVASPGPFTIGTTPIPFTQFSGAGEIAVGTGLSKTGNTLSVTPGTYDASGAAAAAQAASTPALAQTAVQTANYTAAANQLVPVSTASGAVTVTLPAVPANGTIAGVKLVTLGTGNAVTVACAGSDAFNTSGGGTTLTWKLLNQGVFLQYDSGVWMVLSDDLPLGSLTSTFPADWLNVKAYGALVNGQVVQTGAMTASSATLTVGAAAFTTADVGKLIQVRGAGTASGSASGDLNTTISAYVSSTQVTLSANATTTVTAATVLWGSDDYVAVQAALNAAMAVGGTVYQPVGLSFHGTEYSITAPVRWTGAGSSAVMSVNCAGINFQNTYITNGGGETTENNGLEIDHLIFDVTGGHVFYNTNFNGCHWHDLYLVQHSPNYAAWYSNSPSANQLGMLVENVVSFVYGTPRSTPAWYVLSFIGGGLALCEFRRCTFQNQGNDTTQYLVNFRATGTHDYLNQLNFIDCTFAQAFGGCVNIEAGQDVHFQGCGIVDTFASSSNGFAVPGNSMYRVAMNPGSQWVTGNVSFRDMSRDLQGPNGSTTWDIFLDPINGTFGKVLIQNYGVRFLSTNYTIPADQEFYPYFNLGGNNNVILIGTPDAVITNPGSDLIAIGAGADGVITGTVAGVTDWFNVKAYGAKVNGKSVSTGAITASSTTLTLSAAAFTAADVGKLIQVQGAGTASTSASADLNTTIAAYVSSTQVTLSAAATTSAGPRSDSGCGTTNGTATVTDAAAVSGDQYKSISGPGIPGGAYITSVTPSTGYVISANATATASGLTFVVGGGATVVWGSDDSTAVQNAINAAQAVGGTVYSPAGISMHATEYSITGPVRWTGAGSSTIMSLSCAGINFQGTYIQGTASGGTENNGLEIDHLVFDVTGGHVFYNLNSSNLHFHDMWLVEHSPNYSAIALASAASYGSVLNWFIEDVSSYVYGTTRTVPAWNLASSAPGGTTALCEFRRCEWQNQGSDTTQYMVVMSDSGQGNYVNQVNFVDCTFAQVYGGAVSIAAGQDVHFQGCGIVDTFAKTPGNSMYHIVSTGTGATVTGGSSTGWQTANISFRDCSRDLQGPTGSGSSTYDIYLDASGGSVVDKVLIENYGVRDIPSIPLLFYPYFNLGGATNVVIIGCPNAVITNPGSDLINIGGVHGASATVTAKNLAYITGGTLTGYTAPAVAALTSAATIAVNAALGNDFRVTLGINATLGTPTNPVDGQRIDFMVTQPASGGPYTLAYSAAYIFSGSLPPPTLTTAAGYTDILGFIYSAALGGWLFVSFLPGFN